MISIERAHLRVIAHTHPGMKGKINEDRYAVSAFRVSENDPTPSVFAVICDGIGGHRAGEIAAEMAVETISRAVAKSNAENPTPILEAALGEASQKIFAQAESNLDQKGMGATCVAAWIIGDRLYTVSVGDSRLHLIRGDSIIQLTTDHTWIQEALDYGALTPEQARNHPNQHVIRRYLGSQKALVPDFRLKLRPDESDQQAEANQGTRLLPGDFLVLCSDGLTDLVEKQEILQAMKSQDMDQALNSLIDLANQRGGHDNITVVALEVPAQPVRSAAPTVVSMGSQKRKIPSTLAIGLVILGILGIGAVAVVSFVLFLYVSRPTATPSLLKPTQTLVVSIPSATITPVPSLTPNPSATLSPSPTASPSPTPQAHTSSSTSSFIQTPTVTVSLNLATLTLQVPSLPTPGQPNP